MTALEEMKNLRNRLATERADHARAIVEIDEVLGVSRVPAVAAVKRPIGRPRGKAGKAGAKSKSASVRDYLKKHGPARAREVGEATGVGRAFASTVLHQMAHAGQVRRIEPGLFDAIADAAE